jgi:hypothetical protein
MIGDCRHCKDWRGCRGQWYRDDEGKEAEWYSYGDIRWCSYQVFWILKHSEHFDSGRWPKPPRSLECDAKKHARIIREAAFCKPKRIIGEVRARLTIANCREERRVLTEQVINREKLMYLDDDIKQLVRYLSGRGRKITNFREWNKAMIFYRNGKNKALSQRHYRQKVAV